MKQMLWINACMRGEGHSRTRGLCQAFLEEWKIHNPDVQVLERDLTGGELGVLTAQLARRRDEAVAAQQWESPLLEISREFAQADYVVVGAPYWDLSFPAALKVYLEWASTVGVTFCYTEEGAPAGLCRADKLLYITTAGGPVWGQNFGFDYVKGLCGMFGIGDIQCVAAEELDIWGGPGEENLRRARETLLDLAQNW